MEGFFPDRDDVVNHEVATTPKFVTARDAFESITCPSCGEAVERFDLEEDDDGETWWDRFEQRLYESADAQNEEFDMPCCQARVAAAEMELGDGATFARFALWLHRPGDTVELSAEQAQTIAAALGCQVKWMTGVNS